MRISGGANGQRSRISEAGNRDVRIDPLQRLSVFAAITGLLLAGLFAVQLVAGLPRSDMLPMLLAAVVGFELFLFVQDLAARRKRRG